MTRARFTKSRRFPSIPAIYQIALHLKLETPVFAPQYRLCKYRRQEKGFLARSAALALSLVHFSLKAMSFPSAFNEK
jgi:hypothetical protein